MAAQGATSGAQAGTQTGNQGGSDPASQSPGTQGPTAGTNAADPGCLENCGDAMPGGSMQMDSTDPGGMAGSAGDGDGGDGDGVAGGGAAACVPCTDYGAPMMLAKGMASGLDQLSGMTAGAHNPGVLFAANDLDDAVVYAVATDGSLLGEYALQGSQISDLEAVAVGPCGMESCLYLGDIGGNLSPRTEFAIVRIKEPATPDPGSPASETVDFERFPFKYDDGKNRNAEALLVDPGSGTVYVVTKESDGKPSTVYRLPNPLVAGEVNMAVELVDLPVPKAGNRSATGASAHPCGEGFILRTYDTVYEFRIPAGTPFEDAFAAAPVERASGTERQSEGITYLADGSGFLTSGEGAAAPIYQSLCQ